MITCKDCIHYDVCIRIRYPSMYGLTGEDCEEFKNKSRFIQLPCKVGDEVYVPAVWAERLIRFVIVRCEIYAEEIIFTDDSDNEYHIEDFGKTVFLAREEAEAEIERRKHEHH